MAKNAVCQNCGWPLLTMTDAASLQMANDWAAQVYREVLRLKKDLGISLTKPASTMNEQLLDSTDLMEPLRAEIKTLANGMKVIAKEQDDHTADIGKLSDRLQELDQLLQGQKTETAATFQQQSLENEKIHNQQQELRKTVNQQTKVINDLIKAMNGSASVALTPARESSVIAIAEAPPSPPISLTAGNDDHRATLSEEDAIVAEYNRKVNEVPLAWREQFMSVSLDPEAFIRLRDGDDSNIVFTRDRKGNYLILPRGGYCYLVPNKQRKIISQIYITTKAIYDCAGYNESYREFHLVKPALVAEEAADCWRLSRKGILQFT